MPIRNVGRAGARRRQSGSALGWLCAICVFGGIGCALRLVIACAVIAAAATGMLLHELRKGPIPLPVLAETAERLFADRKAPVLLDVDGAVLTLTGDTARPTLRFRGVRVRAREDGRMLLAVPEMGARFALSDLVLGDLSPLDIRIEKPTARVLRTADGRIRFDLGAVALPTEAPGANGSAAEDAPAEGALTGFEAVNRVLDGLAGAGPAAAGTERLQHVRINRANLSFVNQLTKSRWSADGATLTLNRGKTALIAQLVLPIAGMGEQGGRIRLDAVRPYGGEIITATARFRNLRPAVIAREIPELNWLAPIEARVRGSLSVRILPDGTLDDIVLAIEAAAGRLRAGEESIPFDALSLEARYDAERDQVALERLYIDSAKAEATLSGIAMLQRGEAGGLSGLAVQADLRDLRLALPQLFADPLGFEAGQVVARVGFEPLRLEIAEARLEQGPFTLSVSGTAARQDGEDRADLRATGRGMTVAELKAFWPLKAAPNARRWVVENIESGRIDQLLAQIRLGEGEPQVALDFTFSDLVSRYLGDLPPITGATGSGHLNLQEFHLAMAAGQVEPSPGGVITLDGSRLKIFGFDRDVPPADIDIRGEGPVDAVLQLIDRSPLNLVQKLGLPAEDVAGRATVRTTLFFPLLAALKLEEIEVDARAELNDVRATLAIGRLPELRAESEALSLTATTSEMRLSGDARLEDAPVTVEWRERYGAASGGRSLALEGTLTPALLAQRGSPLPGFTGGSMAATLALTQETGQPAGLRIEGDLAAAALSLPEIGWEKAVGVPGAVALAGTVGERAAFDTLRFDAPGLLAEGSASLAREGGIETLRLTSLKLDDRVDLAVDIARGSPGAPEGYSISATGALFDIGLLGSASSAEAERGSDAAEEPPIPIALDFEIAALRLNDEITLRPAQGRVSREASGALGAVFDGAVGGTAAVAGQIALPKDGDGTLGLEAPDAGAFLRAIDVASEASGGQFALDARLSDGGLDAVDGTVVMQNIRLTEGSAFNRIVRQGEGSVTIETDAQGGFSFRDVTMPFSYRSGEIRLSDAIATGPALAVRLGGRVDPVSDDLDLRGVISPAYALTGFLNNVPVLGQILTGSRGEGIFGMTFQVRGSLNDPDISVNPFSLLAPGILRRLFTVGVSEGDENPARDAQSERFREQLGPKR